MFDAELYREKSEVEEWEKEKIPIPSFRNFYERKNSLRLKKITEIRKGSRCQNFQEAITLQEMELGKILETWRDLYTLKRIDMSDMIKQNNYREAIKQLFRFHAKMTGFLMGEDVGN